VSDDLIIARLQRDKAEREVQRQRLVIGRLEDKAQAMRMAITAVDVALAALQVVVPKGAAEEIERLRGKLTKVL
jgi:hypothetical protein